QVTTEDAKSYFEANPQQFMMPPSINVQYLNLDYPAGTKDEEKKAIKDKAYEISVKIQAGDKLETIAKSYALDLKESGFFDMNQPNLSLGWSYDTLEKIFNLSNGQVSEPIETPTGFQFLSVKDRKEASQPGFDSVKNKVVDAIKTRKGFEIAQQKATEAVKSLQEKLNAAPEMTFNSAAGDLNLKTQQTPVFNRGQYLPVIGLSKEFQDAAYDLTEKDKLSPAIATAKGYCILYRDLVMPVEEAEFQKAKDKYASALIEEKRNQMIVDFMTEARLRADVQNNLPKTK
ncbi:MAG: peptidyl-prolyl cis-trans isomerase, partial [Candidatus Omnitrophica bacterium]|nr:peptidyl-prolyl cis-trans isomerase [Candidatus Omnitrophota bacterium]